MNKHRELGAAWRPLRYLLAAALTVLLTACGDEPSPEEQLRAAVAAGEAAIVARDLGAAMEWVDPDYRDARQRDWRQVRALLAGYFLRHPSIHVISKIDRIELTAPDRARVLVFAGLAGSAQEAAGPLSGWRGNLVRLELEFQRNDEGDWLVRKADWRPATREDFVEVAPF